MYNQLSNNPDRPASDSEEVCSKLTIFVDKEGDIAYNCDWEPTEEGLMGVASIFYKLLVDDMPMKIFDEIKAQCVLNNAENDFIAIENLIQQYSTLEGTSDQDDVVVPPDRIINL
jgi:hypothetical protein